ncbi:MAG: hypothetical protein H8E90_01740 [Anaerolineales bacterium]|nr:hypothetical protein [Anaerolineales bacterium]
MKRRKVMRILFEEALRAMAVFGVLVFSGMVPLANQLGVPAGTTLLGALGIAFGGFVLFVSLRLKTGREFKVTSRRGRIALAVVLVGIMILADLAVHLTVAPEAPWTWWKILGVILIAALFTWLNGRMVGTDS